MNSQKRRDKKGRILQEGERQRKDGMYEFRYTDVDGKRRSIYSWKLVETDRAPAGHEMCIPLRNSEKEIRLKLDSGVNAHKSNTLTLNDVFDLHIRGAINIKESTRVIYNGMFDRYVRHSIGEKKIANIKRSELKNFYVDLLNKNGLSIVSVKCVSELLGQLFKEAYLDNIISYNPAVACITDIKKNMPNQTCHKRAMTIEEQCAFLNYCQSTKHRKWMPLITTLLGTGGRISEITSLRAEDCDFENGLISINHSFMYIKLDGDECRQLHVTTPKTSAGSRIVPMFEEVRRALLTAIEISKKYDPIVVDNMTGFIFRQSSGKLIKPISFDHTFSNIIKEYNLNEARQAEIEDREPLLLGNFTPHSLRHTFCTRLCENEANIKVIQEVMGHANISITMDIYADATNNAKVESFTKLQGKIRIV